MPQRKCSVEISNNSNNYTLSQPRLFLESGHCEIPLPPMIGPCSAVRTLFNKTTGTATGAVGVFTYDLFNADLNDYNHVMAVMFSVPYDRNLFCNWFAVGFFGKQKKCDHRLFNSMYNGSETHFVRGKADGSCISYESDFVVVSASMTDSVEAVLRVDISDTGIY
ncbi:Fragaceatoxin C [Oryzias melastigma]|uniref:Fragaceatoxin C n=1 Tax=Oryzias melastigma TaxID=30732 RepID=A0A834FJM8_ORYME|nr:DELTA-stichotoxin-Hcr4b [Oryzias melastigma]KAF6735425.1 Fragaceatoxin C [Oryzias melastigma]